jgi:hypothetical protein
LIFSSSALSRTSLSLILVFTQLCSNLNVAAIVQLCQPSHRIHLDQHTVCMIHPPVSRIQHWASGILSYWQLCLRGREERNRLSIDVKPRSHGTRKCDNKRRNWLWWTTQSGDRWGWLKRVLSGSSQVRWNYGMQKSQKEFLSLSSSWG